MVEGTISPLDSWEATITKAIVATSLADRRQSNGVLSRPVPQSLVFTTFDAALNSVQAAVTRPATVLSLQAVMCVQLFLVSMLRLNAASRLGGLIVRMAFQLGLHRCPTRFSSFSREDQQLRKRVFWSIYSTERHICHALGLPLTIRDDDVDVCFLDEEQHQHQNPRSQPVSGLGDGSQPTFKDERLQLLTFLAKHAKVRGSIMELRNKRIAERNESNDAAILINAELMHWWNEVEDFLDQAESQTKPMSNFHRAVLATLKNESIIALNRPLLALAKDTASYASGIHSCIGAAKSIIAALHSLWLLNVPIVWPSFTWATWMSAFIILYSASEGQLTQQATTRNTDRSLLLLQNLALRGTVWPGACAVAIEDLRSTLSRRSSGAKTFAARSGRRGTASGLVHGPRGESPLQAQQTGGLSTDVERTSPSFNRDKGFVPVTQIRFNTPAQPYSEMTGSQPPTAAASDAKVSDSTGRRISIFGGTGFGEAAFDTRSYSTFTQQDTANPVADELWPDMNVLPKDVPPFTIGDIDPFQGFDIPFWVGQDNYAAWMGPGS